MGADEIARLEALRDGVEHLLDAVTGGHWGPEGVAFAGGRPADAPATVARLAAAPRKNAPMTDAVFPDCPALPEIPIDSAPSGNI